MPENAFLSYLEVSNYLKRSADDLAKRGEYDKATTAAAGAREAYAILPILLPPHGYTPPDALVAYWPRKL